MSKRIILSLFILLSLPAVGQQPDSLLVKKTVYRDYLFLHNLYRGSQNPTSISREALPDVADVRAGYRFEDGSYRAPDAGNIQKTFDFSFYGIKKLEKVSFEGELSYSNISDRGRRWNSSMFVATANPFVIADSISANFGTEKFHLNGGFSYEATPDFHVGLRADYQVGSTANQTDPRPETDGMRFRLNPGADYRFGAFTAGLSGHVEWLSESTEYTVVRTTDGTHYVFLFHGLGEPVLKTAIGYRRKYSGTSGGGNVQLAWHGSRLQNLLTVGMEKSREEAEDGGSVEKYKGGKYASTGIRIGDRLRIAGDRRLHHIEVLFSSHQVEGTSYQQEQHTTSEGNVFWEVVNASICHDSNYADWSVSYRFDRLTALGTPHLTVRAEGGARWQDMTHYSELYHQEYSLVYGKVSVGKLLPLKKFTLRLDGEAAYVHRLSDRSEIEQTKVNERFMTPRFEYASGSRWSATLRAELLHPLSVGKFRASIGGFAVYRHTGYLGDYSFYENTSRRSMEAGVQLIF